LGRTTVRERLAKGIAKAKDTCDREPKLTDGQLFTARGLIVRGVPKAAVARELGVRRQTLYTALNGDGAYSED